MDGGKRKKREKGRTIRRPERSVRGRTPKDPVGTRAFPPVGGTLFSPVTQLETQTKPDAADKKKKNRRKREMYIAGPHIEIERTTADR